MPRVRLQKYLSMAGVCSRRSGESLIRSGRVSVNGERVAVMGVQVDPSTDHVALDGQRVVVEKEPLVIALNKPKGYVSSCKEIGKPVVIDLMPHDKRLFPVGRLDKESTGLLILTNQGSLHHRLLHPSFDHEKEYEVTTAAPIPDEALDAMAVGLLLDDGYTRPAVVRRISSRRFHITLKEGKNRQIRRMVKKVGSRVMGLKRTRFAGVSLGSLQEGQWRYLTPKEVRRLMGLTLPTDKELHPDASPNRTNKPHSKRRGPSWPHRLKIRKSKASKPRTELT